MAEYPDSGKVMARSHPPGAPSPAEDGLDLVTRADELLDYFDGEV